MLFHHHFDDHGSSSMQLIDDKVGFNFLISFCLASEEGFEFLLIKVLTAHLSLTYSLSYMAIHLT